MTALHVERSGPASAPDVLLVHGWAMHGGLWGELVESLAARYRVHVVDLPGHGLSDEKVPDADIAAWAEAVLAVAPPRAVWIGWSLGGLIAQSAAHAQPDRVSALGLLASTPSFVARADWPHAVPLEQLTAFASALASNAEATLSRFLSLQVRGAANAASTLRALRASLVSRPTARQSAMQAGLKLLLESDLRDTLSGLDMPVIAMFGDRDTLIPVEAAQGLLALNPRLNPSFTPWLRVETIAGAGHAPFWSHSRAVCERLDRWLADAI
ncbi:MAG: pimeloyl-ACP methyl ester esterase BioH [Gammaproteobacteria bacterium]|nr:pimeloyl-ACP methyl ester esterase BioH [Gammaproteobacteria bacterium]MCP5137885.1 pimeloyl-ACP methyl ester esterase BioH [Gammaproteobacteria bacterium]